MSELCPQLVSVPKGFAPLFIHERYLIVSHHGIALEARAHNI